MSSKPRGYTLSDTFFLSSFFSFQESRNSKILFQFIKQKAVLQEQVLIAGCEKLLQKVESSSTFCNKICTSCACYRTKKTCFAARDVTPVSVRRYFRVIRDLTKPWRRRQRERKKLIGLMSKTTTLQVHHASLYISLPSLHNYDVKDQILSLLGNGNGKAINSTISVWTWARSPLSSSSQNPLLLSNRANWDNRDTV